MATQSIRFDFLSAGAGKLARDFKSTGDNAAAGARGAKVLQDVISSLGQKENRTAAESAALAKALKLTGDAEDRAAAKAVAADAAIRRLDDALAEEERKALEAAAANRTLGDSFDKLAEKAGGASLGGALAALTPALIPLAGGLAAGVGAIGVSFGAAAAGAGLFGALAKTVFSNVSKDSQKLQTAQKQLAAAQIARAQATTKAQRAAADNQIAAAQDTIAAIRSEGPAYNQVLDLSKEIGTKWKATAAQIASPALVPWLSAVSKGIGFIRPLVQPVADQFRAWGVAVDRYFSSSAGSAEITRLATAFGRFSADQLSALGVFLTDVGKAVLNLGRDLAGHNVDFGAFSVHLDQWGGAFLRWSQSAAARQDVTKFLNWIHSNGPATAGLLKNLGGVLKAFAPGLSGVGSLELKLVSDFLGLLARTPKSIAGPLTETAGALLLLQKTGVLKVGIKIVGAAVKWLTGGVINIGGGAAAGAEIRAAFTTGGAAAAAEIRAALAGGLAVSVAGTAAGGAAAGAEGAATGGIIARLLPKGMKLLVKGGIAFAAVDIVFNLLSSIPSGPGGKNWLENPFGMPGPKDKASANNWLTSWSPYINTFKKNIGGLTAFVSGSWRKTQQDTTSTWNSITGFLSGSWHKLLGDSSTSSGKIRGDFTHMSSVIAQAMQQSGRAADALRTRNLTPLLGESGRVSGGIQGLAGLIRGGLAPAIDTGGRHADSFRTRNLGPLQGSLSRTSGGVQGLQHYINILHGKTVNVGAHLSGSGGVQVTPSTGAPGAKNYAVYFKPLAAGGRLPGFGGGDRIPIMAEAGEAVVDKHRTRRYAPVLKAMGVPGFTAGGLVGNLAADTGHDVAGEAKAGLAAIVAAMRKAILQALVPSTGYIYRAGSGVQQWRGVVRQALGLAGANVAQLTDPVLYQMQTESGGNPTIVNRTDSNWFAGHPSVGLMQVIRGTFQAYAGRYRGTGPFEYGVSVNPLANVYSAIKYAQANYGPGLRNAYGGIGTGHGYDRGGWLMPGLTLAYNGTGRPEQVIPPSGARGGGNVTVVLENRGVIGSEQQLQTWLVRQLNMLARGGRLTQAVRTASR